MNSSLVSILIAYASYSHTIACSGTVLLHFKLHLIISPRRLYYYLSKHMWMDRAIIINRAGFIKKVHKCTTRIDGSRVKLWRSCGVCWLTFSYRMDHVVVVCPFYAAEFYCLGFRRCIELSGVNISRTT